MISQKEMPQFFSTLRIVAIGIRAAAPKQPAAGIVKAPGRAPASISFWTRPISIAEQLLARRFQPAGAEAANLAGHLAGVAELLFRGALAVAPGAVSAAVGRRCRTVSRRMAGRGGAMLGQFIFNSLAADGERAADTLLKTVQVTDDLRLV